MEHALVRATSPMAAARWSHRVRKTPPRRSLPPTGGTSAYRSTTIVIALSGLQQARGGRKGLVRDADEPAVGGFSFLFEAVEAGIRPIRTDLGLGFEDYVLCLIPHLRYLHE